MTGVHAWIDASAGVAGDMLLGALVDAGADLAGIRDAVAAVAGDAVRLDAGTVTRAGLRATRVSVEVDDDAPYRTWRDVRAMLTTAGLPRPVHEAATRVFATLARVEARAHGIAADDVHFHEVGALDSIADVVGVCAALDLLGVRDLTAGVIAVGSGQARTAHGMLPVPVPAVLELSRGWAVIAGGEGELATPTGMALVTALASSGGPLPALRVTAVGVGAGGRDPADRPNITRVVLGVPAPEGAGAGAGTGAGGAAGAEPAVLIEANVDDLDPRVWPEVLAALLATGASDAWLTPILMKKGRPAHTLHVLAPPAARDALVWVIFAQTSTIGLRESPVAKTPLPRLWVPVHTRYGTVRIKLAHHAGVIATATPEFEDVAALAAGAGAPVRLVLAAAAHAATEAGLMSGVPVPAGPPAADQPPADRLAADPPAGC